LQWELKVADKPIVTIPIDDSQFTEFLRKWDKFHTDLKDQSNVWQGINAQVSQLHANFTNAANAYAQMGAAASAAAQGMQGFNTAAHAAAQSTAQINQNLGNARTVQASNQVTKNTKQNAQNWALISKSAATTGRWMSSISRMSIISGGFKLAKAGLQGSVAGFTTAALAYNNLANVNKDSRRLGMRPGQIQAFEDIYGPAGGSRELLAMMAAAKNDKTVGTPLQALGISQEDIAKNDPEKLAAMFLQRSGKMFNQMGENAGQWAQAMRLDNFASIQDMRLAGTYAKQPGAFDQMAEQYQKAYNRIKVDQEAADAATEFTKALKTARDELENNFGAALRPLAPHLVAFTEAAAGWVKWASDLPDVKDTIGQFGSALDKVTAWINSKGATWTWGTLSQDPNKPMLTTGANDKPWTVGGWWEDFKNGFHGTPKKDPVVKQQNSQMAPSGQKADSGDYMNGENGQYSPITGMDKSRYFAALEAQQGLPAGLVQGIENNESHGGDPGWLVGPKTKYGRALGPFQMMKDAARRFHVGNRFDEKESAAGAALYLRMLRRRYSGDSEKAAAAYNWGEGNLDNLLERSQSSGKDWHAGLPPETAKYLRKLKEQGVDFSSTMTKAKFDQQLKPQSQKLNEDDFKIVDLSKEGRGGMDARETTEAVSLGVLSGLQRFYANYFREGGGEGMRGGKSGGKGTQSQQTMPAQVNVKVSTPAGASTNVTMGGIPR
jgi:hypothetical protein